MHLRLLFTSWLRLLSSCRPLVQQLTLSGRLCRLAAAQEEPQADPALRALLEQTAQSSWTLQCPMAGPALRSLLRALTLPGLERVYEQKASVSVAAAQEAVNVRLLLAVETCCAPAGASESVCMDISQ